jgi:hypothetical protein
MWALRETGGRRTSVLLKAPQMFTIGYGFTPHKPVRAFVDGYEQMKI